MAASGSGRTALHGRIDAVVELDYRVVGPELVADLLAQDYLARTFQQHPEDLERLVLKSDPDARFAQFGPPEEGH
jgi:hypothetical protein